jgi:uncharacterized protein (TIGR02611 family)
VVHRALHLTYRGARRIAVTAIGTTVVLAGVAMIVLPGPALVVIPAGIAILGLEFAWARRWLRSISERSRSALAHWGDLPGRKQRSDAGERD